MANEINIGKILNPNSYNLKKTYNEDGEIRVYNLQIIDNEYYPIEIEINWSGVFFNTEDFNWISLDYHTVSYITELMLDFEREKLGQ